MASIDEAIERGVKNTFEKPQEILGGRSFNQLLAEFHTGEIAPVVNGQWVKVSGFVTPGGDPVWRCSECGKGQHVYGIEHGSYGVDVSDGQWVACPNCGAKMDEYAPACGPDYCEI